MLTVAFRGLSSIVERPNDKVFEVLLNPAGKHIPTLSILTKFLYPKGVDPGERWDPDFIGYVPVFDGSGALTGFEQMAVWEIGATVLTFAKGGGQAPTFDSGKLIQLQKKHPNTKAHKAGSEFGVVRLETGKGSATRELRFDVTQDSKTCEEMLATEIRWTDLPLLLSAKGKKMALADTLGDPVAVVANVAPEPVMAEALKHFTHCYDVIRDNAGGKIDKEKQVTLAVPERASRDSDGVERAAEVYDCIPPADSPP